MKLIGAVGYFVLILIAPYLATTNNDIDAVFTLHEAWELAFERANIDAVESVWADNGEAVIVTPLGTQHKGWAEVKGALQNLFALLGQTTIDVKEPFLTIDGNEASMTTTYRWSPARERIFPLRERYRKIEGTWKLYASETQDNLLSLRPQDEKAIKPLASGIQDALRNKDIPAIATQVTADFTYVDTDGTIHHGWQPSANALTADVQFIADLQLQSIALMEDTACGQYMLTNAHGDTQHVSLTFVGPNWKLNELNLNPEATWLSVPLDEVMLTQWARLK